MPNMHCFLWYSLRSDNQKHMLVSVFSEGHSVCLFRGSQEFNIKDDVMSGQSVVQRVVCQLCYSAYICKSI